MQRLQLFKPIQSPFKITQGFIVAAILMPGNLRLSHMGNFSKILIMVVVYFILIDENDISQEN
jgi:hypothetical protein